MAAQRLCMVSATLRMGRFYVGRRRSPRSPACFMPHQRICSTGPGMSLCEPIGLGEFRIELRDPRQRFTLLGDQVLWVLEQAVSRSLDGLVLAHFLAAHPGDGVSKQLEDMELVEGDLRLRKMFGDALDDDWRHIARYCSELIRLYVALGQRRARSAEQRLVGFLRLMQFGRLRPTEAQQALCAIDVVPSSGGSERSGGRS